MEKDIVKVITCGQVQDYLNDYYKKNNEKISFYEAYHQMKSNEIQGKQEKLNSFLKWNTRNKLDFDEFYHRLPVETESIKRNLNTKGIPEVVEEFLFPGKDAVILKYAYNTGLDLIPIKTA